MSTKSLGLCACLAIMLCGCAKEPPTRPISDTFCLTAEKRVWSIHDTPESIREARIWNATIDRRCGIPGKETA